MTKAEIELYGLRWAKDEYLYRAFKTEQKKGSYDCTRKYSERIEATSKYDMYTFLF